MRTMEKFTFFVVAKARRGFYEMAVVCGRTVFPPHKGQLTLNGVACIIRVKICGNAEKCRKMHHIPLNHICRHMKNPLKGKQPRGYPLCTGKDALRRESQKSYFYSGVIVSRYIVKKIIVNFHTWVDNAD